METTKMKRVDNIPWQGMNDRALLLQPDIHMGHEVFGVGTWIWEKLANEISMDELLDQMIDEFEVDREVAFEDTRDFIQGLRNYGLIQDV